MKQIDFPISVAAVRLHGREFHEQDFYVPSNVTREHVNLSLAEKASPPPGADPVEGCSAARGRVSLLGESVKKLARWTLTCIALALAAALVLSWLVRPDVVQVKWVEAPAFGAVLKAR